MRIISGRQKKRIIRPPKGFQERPTTDRAKEGLFNIIANRFDLDGMRILDLFSGTGNIAYEFCSRSEAKVTAVEKDRRLCSFIVRNAMEMNMTRLNVENKDVYRFLEGCKGTYQLIFADPPYAATDHYERSLQLIRERGLLGKDGRIILEHDERFDPSQLPSYEESRTFGNTSFSFFHAS